MLAALRWPGHGGGRESRMKILQLLKDRARAHPQHIVLPEGSDTRTLKAAAQVAREGFARLTVLGPAAEPPPAALHCVGLGEEWSTVSSFFLMILPRPEFGLGGALLYADCGVIPDPTPAQLADIARQTAENPRAFLETEPRVALLSFSTKGSAEHARVEKVREALRIIKAKKPDLLLDGEEPG